ncbi:hypothetical protein D918_00023 [Trichuris suis]|nr:hypothetical protein D918_00023 [Trichuris suis]
MSTKPLQPPMFRAATPSVPNCTNLRRETLFILSLACVFMASTSGQDAPLGCLAVIDGEKVPLDW